MKSQMIHLLQVILQMTQIILQVNLQKIHKKVMDLLILFYQKLILKFLIHHSLLMIIIRMKYIILWIMKYQQHFNISDIGIKFLHYILIHFKINEADNFLTSMFTVKSSLGILTKYKKYVACLNCHKLYELLDVKNYKEDNKSVCKRCIHIEYFEHKLISQRSVC